ncbi:MAG TPA: APC family permease [Streptosporangiaceae bacterium]|nr:APC family permease [Streptosporangiaceae bacterium]
MAERTRLRRQLKPWEALALSIGLMAPTLAMALNGPLPSSRVGAKVPLVFVIGFLGVILVAYGFVRLTRYFNHAGSVYALAGKTLGPRAGFFSGFTLLGVYVSFTICSLAATALFFSGFLADVGIHAHIPWFAIALAAGLLMLYLNTRPVRIAARSLLTFEGFGILLIAVLVVVIFARILSGHAPHGQTFAVGATFTPGGIKFGTLISATVFAFLSWAGFEASASLGEETTNPRRNIPRSIIGALAISAVFYIVTMFAETIGFGTNAAGVAAFSGSSNAVSDLAKAYIGGGLATVLSLAAAGSAFASAMSSGAGAGRMVFALSRDGFGPAILSKKSERHGAPVAALIAVFAVSLVADLVMSLYGTTEVNVYFYYATIGVLGIIVVYAAVALGTIRFIITRRADIPRIELLIPLVGVAYLAYVFYEQLAGVSPPYTVFPYLVAAWCVLGLAAVVIRPSLARRIGEQLTAEIDDPDPAEAGQSAGKAV